MPCKTCGNKLIYIDDDPNCPTCEQLSVVPYNDSIVIADFLIKKIGILFFNAIKNAKKRQILANVFWAREKQIRNFTRKHSLLKITRLVSCNLLLRRLIQFNGFLEKEDINEGKIEDVIEIYEALVAWEENKIGLKSENFIMLKFKKYDLSNLERLRFDDIQVCPNEDYNRILKTMAKHNVMPEKKAQEKMEEWSKIQIPPSKPGSNRSKTSKETIIRFYDLISEFYIAFFRNHLYTEAFGFPDKKKIVIDPMDLKIFATSYPISDGLSYREFHDFRAELILKFGGKFKRFLDNFVLSENNLSVIPLFLQLDNIVFISQSYCQFFSYVLHAVLNKGLFDDETEKRSRKFEAEIVKGKFLQLGAKKYHPPKNIKNKMEIDGIAIFGSITYVIEVKGWGVRRLIEEKTSKTILLRDIKNSVDGLKYNDVTKTTKRKGPSLPKKIQWIDRNRKRFMIPDSSHLQGILILSEESPISEYKNCLIQYIENLDLTQ